MTAPHFHTTSEAKAAINKVEHNKMGTFGGPTGIAGGSGGNQTTLTPEVTSTTKGDDWLPKRGISGSSKG